MVYFAPAQEAAAEGGSQQAIEIVHLLASLCRRLPLTSFLNPIRNPVIHLHCLDFVDISMMSMLTAVVRTMRTSAVYVNKVPPMPPKPMPTSSSLHPALSLKPARPRPNVEVKSTRMAPQKKMMKLGKEEVITLDCGRKVSVFGHAKETRVAFDSRIAVFD